MADINTTIGTVRESVALSPPRSAAGRTPSGYRVLHVIVPEAIFNHVKAQAYLSGMRFPEYVAGFLKDAWPFKANCQPSQLEETQAADLVSAQGSKA